MRPVTVLCGSLLALAVVLTVAGPLLRSGSATPDPAAPEADPLQTIGVIYKLQVRHRDNHGVFLPDLATLVRYERIAGADRLAELAEDGALDGYRYVVEARDDGYEFSVTAIPPEGPEPRRSWYTDETGVARFHVGDRPANASDTPIGCDCFHEEIVDEKIGAWTWPPLIVVP